MAYFAEIDENNIVLRVNCACDIDVSTNGGDKSEQAAEKFKTVSPLSEKGIKWIQTSVNFRKQMASIGFSYDPIKDIFISPKPYSSWILDSNNDWQPPIEWPTIKTYGENNNYILLWDDDNQKWLGKDHLNNEFEWIPSSSSWIATGN